MKKSKTWGEFYDKPASEFAFVRDIMVHLKYLLVIILKRPKRILEAGTGTGIQSIFLSRFTGDATALDFCKKVILSTRINIRHSRANVNLILADAFSMPFKDGSFDVCYSQGFLEHFADHDIVRLLREQLRVSRSFVHSVPSDHYPWKQFGNERHLALSAWHNLVSKSLNEDPHFTLKVSEGYLPLVKWYIMIEAKPADTA